MTLENTHHENNGYLHGGTHCNTDVRSLAKTKLVRWPCCHNMSTDRGGNSRKDLIMKSFIFMADRGATHQHTANSKWMDNISNTKNWMHNRMCSMRSISVDEVE